MRKPSIIFFCCLIGMLGFDTATSDSFDYNPSFIRFPFARSGSDFTNTCKGYGDYNAGDGLKLFHSGVDIQAVDTTEYVRTPFDPAYVIHALNVPGSSEWRVIMGLTDTAETGWGYHHLYNTAGFVVGDTLSSLISPVVVNEPEVGTHVHIDWCIHVDSIQNQQIPGGGWVLDVYDSCINPLDFFLNKPSNYDFPELGEVSGRSTGLRIQNFQCWLPDTTVFGQVRFVARPVSAPQQQQGLSTDSVGVRYLRHRVLRQDPYTGEYLPLPWYDWRTLFSMNGFIPFLGDDFFDFVYATTSAHYRSEYILNNCGTTPVGLNADSAFTNVWTAGYDRSQDWADGVFCRGAFDTRLGFDFIHQQSYDNGTAMIPDGRYCVEMEAYSHGSSQAQTWRLPVFDVAAENLSPGDSANVRGFIVDNFAPHIESVLVYLEALPGEPDTVYSAEWALATESLRSFSDSTRMYLSSDEEQWIGVALKLSEPMDSLPAVWITGEWGGEVRWSSDSIGSDYQFIPCEWDVLNLGEMPVESNSSGHWQCYRTELGIAGYHGNLCLNIGGGMDFSGNSLDGDPSTIAVRDTLSGVFSGYEQVDDCSYAWETGFPNYFKPGPSDIVLGYLPNVPQFRVQLDRTQSGMDFEGSSPFQQGFWLFDTQQIIWRDGSYAVQVVDFTGETVLDTLIQVRFPCVEQPAVFSNVNRGISLDTGTNRGDYLWFLMDSCRSGYSLVDCVAADRDTEMLWPWPHPVHVWLDVHFFSSAGEYHCFEIAYGVDESLYWPHFNALQPLPDDDERVVATYRRDGISYCVILSPPGSDGEFPEVERITLEDERQSVQDEGSVNVFGLTVSCNPVSSQVMLQVTLEQAGLVELSIHDLTGREVQRVLDEELPAGVHSIASQVNLPSGVYFCRLRSGGDVATGKLLIVR